MSSSGNRIVITREARRDLSVALSSGFNSPFCAACSKSSAILSRFRYHQSASSFSVLNLGTILRLAISVPPLLQVHSLVPRVRLKSGDNSNCRSPDGPNDHQKSPADGDADRHPPLLAVDDLVVKLDWIVLDHLLGLFGRHVVLGNVAQVCGVPVELDPV